MDIALQPTASPAFPARRINVRLIVLMLLAATPFIWLAKVMVVGLMSGGIVDRGSYVEVDLKALGNFPFAEDIDTIDAVPQRYRALDGKRVRLEGEMYCGNSSASKLDRFELVYSIIQCCTKGPPKVHERVYASMPKGKTTRFYGPGYVRVFGTLRVKDVKDAGRTVSIYTMVVDSIEPM